MNKILLILKFLKSIIAILPALMLFSCENDLEVIKNVTKSIDKPIQKSEDLEMIYTDSAKTQFKITAPLAEYLEKSKEDAYYIFTKGIRVYLYNDDKTIKSKISAEWAKYNINEDIWIARDNVVVIDENNEMLLTEELFWNTVTGKIYSNKFVKLIEEGSQTSGVGFESDENLKNSTIKKITGRYKIDKTMNNSGEK